jgi:hypothetical protein
MVSDGAYAYLLGGQPNDGYDPLHYVRRYNPATNTWADLFPLPDVFRAAAAVYGGNGRIYVFNGLGFFSSTRANTRIYDIAADSWSLGTPPPFGLFDMAAGYYNGKIYLVGGMNTRFTIYQQVWIYEIASNTWDTSLTALPNARAAAGSGVIAGRWFLAGGRDNFTGYLNTLDIYDTATNTWTAGAALPQAVRYPGSAVLDGKLWLIGGQGPSGWVNVTQIYDPATNSWSAGPTLAAARAELAAAAVGPYVVAAGGYNNGSSFSLVEVSTNPLPCGTTPTPTATTAPTHTPAPVITTITGAIADGDFQANQRLLRDGGVASCAVPKGCPGNTGPGPFRYDVYPLTNTSGSARCILVTLDATGCGAGLVTAYVYHGPYDPNNICTNYGGDEGTLDPTQRFSINVPAGATYNVVVVEGFPGPGCPSYTVTLRDCGPPPTPTPLCIPMLRGHLTYETQSQPDARNVQPLTLKLAAGGTVYTFPATSEANGNVGVALTGLPAGSYSWWIKSPQYLALGGTLTYSGACATPQEFGTLRPGDVNDDNLVDLVDFTLLRASFGLGCGDPAYDARTDFNHDCLVDIADFTLLRAHFGEAGPPAPTAPARAKRK